MEMKEIFSARRRSTAWRELWIMLAEAEQTMGLKISDEAIKEMKEHVLVTDADLKVAAEGKFWWLSARIRFELSMDESTRALLDAQCRL